MCLAARWQWYGDFQDSCYRRFAIGAAAGAIGIGVGRSSGEVLQSDPELQKVGFAKRGQEAVAMVRPLRPEVITMDIQMPGMDGFATTKEIMIQQPTLIVVISSATRYAEVE